jgi:serine phosphatase RsbU (regulator of sigma subunit)
MLHLGVPLVAGTEFIGVLVVDDPGERRPFSEREIALLEAIAAQASTALENARLFEAQRDIATTMQQNFIHPLPRIEGLDLAALSLPAGRQELIGGDFHDVFQLPDGLVVALIGDVMGKGIRAAGLTETVRSAVRALALVSPAPDRVLTTINQLLLRQERQQLVTALLAMFDPGNGQGFLASAGHPPAVLVANDGCRPLEPNYGLPLGALEQSLTMRSFAVRPGEALVFYTDGVVEARREGDLFGEERLLEVLGSAPDRTPARLVERLRDAVMAHAGELKDDLEILALRRRE